MKKIILGVLALILGLGAVIFVEFMPTSGFLKNQDLDGVTIRAQSASDTKRSPIIRTYYKDDYDDFDKSDQKKVNSTIVGNVSGEVPAIFLDKDPRVLIKFYKGKKEVDPENPKIRVKSVTTLWDRGETEVLKEIEKNLEKTPDGYTYESKFLSDNKKDPEPLKLEVTYEIAGKPYVSVFAMNQFGEDYEEDY